VEFKSLVLKNFMSYKIQAFDDLSEPELTLISGTNGVGKSTIWDGICWAIFGQTVRGIKGDDVINRLYKKNCSVVVNIGLGKEEVVVVRYRKDSEHGDRFYYQHKGKKYELGSLADTQASLLKLLKIDFDLFRCSILFAQGETFNFVNSTNREQKEVLSKVMRVNYADSLAKAKAAYKKTSEDKISIEGKIAALRGFLKEDAEDFETQIAEWDFENSQDIANNEKAIKIYTKDMDAITVADIDGVREKIDKLERLRSSLETSTSEMSDTWSKNHWESEALAKQNKKLMGLEGDCPTCAQEIDIEKRDSIVAENEAKISACAKRSSGISEKIHDLKSKVSKINVEIKKLNEAVADARVNKEKLKNLQKGVEVLKAAIEQAKEQVNPFHALKEKAAKKRKDVEKQVKTLSEDLIGVDEKLPYLDFWVNAFGDAGIKSFIFDLICSSLTNKSNKYLNILTNGEVTISFDTQKKTKSGELREKFDCEIQRDGERVDYASYSGGEKRRISLAVDIALSEIMSEHYGQKFGMVVFDEQTSYMDDGGRTGFMNLLKEISREKRVFVVDHDPTFKAMFDEVWTVTKNKGVSQVLM
jgi:DNA repair exonuclease SbcCD ATPase subunit